MIDHEFLYACFHPLSDDFVLCLERNIFPSELKMSEMTEIQFNQEGEKTVYQTKKNKNKLGGDADIIEEEEDKIDSMFQLSPQYSRHLINK